MQKLDEYVFRVASNMMRGQLEILCCTLGEHMLMEIVSKIIR